MSNRKGRGPRRNFVVRVLSAVHIIETRVIQIEEEAVDAASTLASTATVKVEEAVAKATELLPGGEEPSDTPIDTTASGDTSEVADETGEAEETEEMASAGENAILDKYPAYAGDRNKRVLVPSRTKGKVVGFYLPNNNVLLGESHEMSNRELVEYLSDHPEASIGIMELIDNNPILRDEEQRKLDVERYKKALKDSARVSKKRTSLRQSFMSGFRKRIDEIRGGVSSARTKSSRPKPKARKKPATKSGPTTPPVRVVVDKPVTRQSLRFGVLLCIVVLVLTFLVAYYMGEPLVMAIWWGVGTAVVAFALMLIYIAATVKE